MKKMTFMLGISFTIALTLSVFSRAMPIEDRLVQIQRDEVYPGNERLAAQPLEVQAVMLDYRRDALLQLKAEAALAELPDIASEVLVRYGAEPEFQEVLRRYGSAAFLPVHYFMHNEVQSLEWRETAKRQWQAMKAHAQQWRREGAVQLPPSNMPEPEAGQGLTPEQRGWHAVNIVAEEGHDFLGQFTRDAQGEIKWLQSERWLEAGNDFFAGGIRQLETQWQRGEPLGYGDIGWAVVDGAVMFSTAKVLRMGRAGRMAARSTGQVGRSAVLASRAGNAARLVRVGRYAQWPAAVAGTYLVLRHPVLINDGLTLVANTLGYPVWLVRLLGWTLLLLPVLYVGAWLVRAVLPLTIRLLRSGALCLMWLERRSRTERYLFR